MGSGIQPQPAMRSGTCLVVGVLLQPLLLFPMHSTDQKGRTACLRNRTWSQGTPQQAALRSSSGGGRQRRHSAPTHLNTRAGPVYLVIESFFRSTRSLHSAGTVFA